MKKAVVVAIVLLSCVGLVFAGETTIAVSGGYSRDANTYEMVFDTDFVLLGPALALDVAASFGQLDIVLIGGVKLSLPTELTVDIDGDENTFDLDSGWVCNGKIGAGYRFFADTRFPLVVGAGGTLVVSQFTPADSDTDFVQSAIGVFGTVQGSVFVTKWFGFMAGLDIGYHFLPVFAQLTDETGSEDMTEWYQSASYFDVRAGIVFRF
ncbi:MAG TPA: hypothetical protein PLU93_01590 [Treponemataceae bacterium]|jgi:hypothetical protein|nr:hypothetical protein [Treponemataceae bacterium]